MRRCCLSFLILLSSSCRKTFQCMLTNTSRDYFCSVKTSDLTPGSDYPDFTDIDTYNISLCRNQTDGSDMCEQLDDEYTPVTNSKDHTDFRLLSYVCVCVCFVHDVFLWRVSSPQLNQTNRATSQFSHNSGQHHFTWNSTYEAYEMYTPLVQSLNYQLHYFRRGDEHDDNKVNTENNDILSWTTRLLSTMFQTVIKKKVLQT